MENIINQYSGTCLSGASSGRVTTFTCTKGLTSQYWTQVPSSDILYFGLMVNSTGKCLQNIKTSIVNIAICNINDTHQQWYNDLLMIKNRASAECLMEQDSGHPVKTFSCGEANGENWKFTNVTEAIGKDIHDTVDIAELF